ncbi:MAG: hypothetical protein NTZ48_02145, partial [Candidatus Omnitrophica bacterium]|nr:hypothetical protein [Candidatus Omnitrophota bacterium]
MDAAALVASTLNISNSDFLAGVYNFNKADGKSGTSIVNQGYIKAGSVSLTGQAVANSGVIEATLGSVALASGDAVTLNLDSAGMISVVIADPVKEAVEGANSAVENSGKISADGGKVILAAKTLNNVFDYAVNQTGVIEAKSLATKNGEIILDGGNSGIVANSGTLDVSGKDAGEIGGTVKVLGEYVGLFDSSIDASGDVGGGTILIGGNLQGKGPEANAVRTYVSQDAIINADAITNGDAGKVIIWSDEATRFYGSISAQGGIEGGNGGFAEVSGKENLTYRGLTNLGSLNGETGTLLLDPTNIVIAGGSADGSDGDNGGANNANLLDNDAATNTVNDAAGTVSFGATPLSFTVYESEIEETGANIILQAANSITVSGTFNQNGNGEGTGSIVRLQNNYSLTMDTRNASGEGSGGINLTGVEFQTQGTGSITIRAGITGTGAGGDAGSAPVTVGALSTLGTGGITLQAEGALTVSGALSTANQTSAAGAITTGSIALSAGGAIGINSAVTTGNADTFTGTLDGLDATSGNITITSTGSSVTLDSAVTTGTAFAGNGGSDIATSGTISITGTSITSNASGLITTGNTTSDGGNNDNAVSGSITLSASGADGVVLAAAVATGTADTDVGAANL